MEISLVSESAMQATGMVLANIRKCSQEEESWPFSKEYELEISDGVAKLSSGNPYPHSLSYLWPERVASSKKKTKTSYSRLIPKMAKIDTLFMTSVHDKRVHLFPGRLL